MNRMFGNEISVMMISMLVTFKSFLIYFSDSLIEFLKILAIFVLVSYASYKPVSYKRHKNVGFYETKNCASTDDNDNFLKFPEFHYPEFLTISITIFMFTTLRS